jgi:transcriptional regulator with XRE-family HTH domain
MKYSFGERLKALRKAAGETQAELAQALGVTQSSLSSLESGVFNASKSTAQIADHYKVNALWLATGEGDKAAPPGGDTDAEEITRLYLSLGKETKLALKALLKAMITH